MRGGAHCTTTSDSPWDGTKMDRAARIFVEGGAVGGFGFWAGETSGSESCKYTPCYCLKAKSASPSGVYYERDDQ
jgi:hypothetical protein